MTKRIFTAILLNLALFGTLALAKSNETQDGTSTESITIPPGPALTEGEIIILLQAHVPVETIQRFVQSRGAGFGVTKEVGKKVIAAGGNVALIGTISLNQKESAPELAANLASTDKKRK